MNLPLRVYYEDTDAGGVVYHARYLHFFERARTEYLRQLGFSQQQLFEKQIAFVVKKIEIDYKSPARLDDLLNVETTLSELKRATMVFSQRLLKGTQILSEASVIVACVNLTQMKPMAIPDDILNALKTL